MSVVGSPHGARGFLDQETTQAFTLCVLGVLRGSPRPSKPGTRKLLIFFASDECPAHSQ